MLYAHQVLRPGSVGLLAYGLAFAFYGPATYPLKTFLFALLTRGLTWYHSYILLQGQNFIWLGELFLLVAHGPHSPVCCVL